MSYIGNTPFTAAFLVDTFSGNGSTVAFTMSVAPANTSSVIVAITGVLQDPSTYSVSGTTLTFSAAPPTGTSNISVRYLGIPASGVTTTAYRTQTEFTATAGQTTFTVPSYTVGYIDVYRNGLLLGSADFTATTGTTVVLANACAAGDFVETVSFYVSSVLNAIPATAGSVGTTYITDASVTQAKLAAGVAGNGPAFFAYQNSVQSLTGGSSIKIQLQAELFDTNSNFDNVTNYRFTPTVAGYYQISGSVMIATTTTTTNIQSVLFKNGSLYVVGSLNVATAAAYPQSVFSVLVYFNGSTDYVELYGYTNVTTGTNPYQQNVYLSGALVRAA